MYSTTQFQGSNNRYNYILAHTQIFLGPVNSVGSANDRRLRNFADRTIKVMSNSLLKS